MYKTINYKQIDGSNQSWRDNESNALTTWNVTGHR